MANWHAKSLEQRTEYNAYLRKGSRCEYVLISYWQLLHNESMIINSIQEQVLSDNCIHINLAGLTAPLEHL